MEIFGPGVCPTPTRRGNSNATSPTASVQLRAPTAAGAQHQQSNPELRRHQLRLNAQRRRRLRPAQAVNFSTRMFVQTGRQSWHWRLHRHGKRIRRTVIVRAIGPSLVALRYHRSWLIRCSNCTARAGFITVINNNWRDTQEQEIQDTGLPPTNNFESAIVATLAPGTLYGDRSRQ